MCVLSPVPPPVTPGTVARQAPLSMGFSRQEYWRGLHFPSLEGLLDPGVKLESPGSPALAGRSFITEPPGEPSPRITTALHPPGRTASCAHPTLPGREKGVVQNSSPGQPSCGQLEVQKR